ncbi:hypothetical protein [Sphingobium sp. S6]|nr:hypothetical protein [Sphingobium sp. S6]CAD7339308.1 hypothetical protein SPHS6_02389 [Sphingobium sp. S6]
MLRDLAEASCIEPDDECSIGGILSARASAPLGTGHQAIIIEARKM